MLQHLDTVSSDKFTWKNGSGTSEYSDMGRRIIKRVFDDACDVGFVIKSAKTGRELVVLLTDTEYDRDNDLVSHTFTAWYERDGNRAKTLSPSERFEVKLFND